MSLPIDFPFLTVGDQGPVSEAWRVEGFDDLNTDRGRLYVTTTVVGSTLQFELFSDRDRTALVMQGAAALNVRAVLAEQNDSGASGSVKVLELTARAFVLFVALATDRDIERRDNRINGLLSEEPAECNFEAVWDLTIREFYLRIQADYPTPMSVSDPLRFPGAGQVQIQGARGMPDVYALDLWRINGEGDWELKGLQNPGDWRTWATLYSLFLIWDREARSGDDNLIQRAQLYLDDSEKAWRRIPVLVDQDGDAIPEVQTRIRSAYLTRG